MFYSLLIAGYLSICNQWRSQRFLNPLDYSIWDILQELLYEGRREPFANVKDLQNVITDKWHSVDDQTMRKAIFCSGKGV